MARTPGAKWRQVEDNSKMNEARLADEAWWIFIKHVGHVPVHISGCSWPRLFPWHRSPSLDLCGAGSEQCNRAHPQDTEQETGLGPALLHLGKDTPLPFLHTHKQRINNHTATLFQCKCEDSRHVTKIFNACLIHTACTLRTATARAAVWGLHQHLPLRKESADSTEFAHFFFLLAQTWLGSDLWCSFLLTYHLTDGERAVLTLTFFEESYKKAKS